MFFMRKTCALTKFLIKLALLQYTLVLKSYIIQVFILQYLITHYKLVYQIVFFYLFQSKLSAKVKKDKSYI